ncbi:hypothetical protein DFH27DRAFT_547954 [Peziza echinospora]|nr:hypothetical protein DFH27DRAFT_547954 [Peziza echinospora]
MSFISNDSYIRLQQHRASLPTGPVLRTYLRHEEFVTMTDQEFNAWADNFLDGLEFAKDQLGISTAQSTERNQFDTRATRRGHRNAGEFGRGQLIPRGHAGGVGAVYVGALQTTGNGTGASVGGRQPKAFKVKRFNTRLRGLKNFFRKKRANRNSVKSQRISLSSQLTSSTGNRKDSVMTTTRFEDISQLGPGGVRNSNGPHASSSTMQLGEQCGTPQRVSFIDVARQSKPGDLRGFDHHTSRNPTPVNRTADEIYMHGMYPSSGDRLNSGQRPYSTMEQFPVASTEHNVAKPEVDLSAQNRYSLGDSLMMDNMSRNSKAMDPQASKHASLSTTTVRNLDKANPIHDLEQINHQMERMQIRMSNVNIPDASSPSSSANVNKLPPNPADFQNYESQNGSLPQNPPNSPSRPVQTMTLRRAENLWKLPRTTARAPGAYSPEYQSSDLDGEIYSTDEDGDLESEVSERPHKMISVKEILDSYYSAVPVRSHAAEDTARFVPRPAPKRPSLLNRIRRSKGSYSGGSVAEGKKKARD